MEHFPEYSNLEGLKAINITKKTEKGLINIPESGEIKEFLENGSILYCDLKTDEFWIKTSLNMIFVTSIILYLSFSLFFLFSSSKKFSIFISLLSLLLLNKDG